MYQVLIASSSSQQVTRLYCCTKRVTPLESSHGHHLPTRAPLRAQLADVVSTPSQRRRHPDAGRARRVQTEHRVGSLLIVGQDQTQAHSSSSTRGSSITPDDGSHIHRIVRPRCRTESSRLRAGRVWACTRPLQSVHAAAEWCAVDELSLIVSYVVSTAAVGRVLPDYYKIVLHINHNPTRYQVPIT